MIKFEFALPRLFIYHAAMEYAIFSDVHNNARALSAVLLDASQRGIEAYICLGDLGTDPSVQLAQSVGAKSIFGNWEVSGWRYLSPAYRQWALKLPPMLKFDRFRVSHAAPVWPENIKTLQQFLKKRRSLNSHALFPYYTSESDALWEAFGALLSAEIPVLFHGHTHQQVSWILDPDNQVKKRVTQSLSLAAGHHYIIGVGSVGLPRDSRQPCYVIFDSAVGEVNFVKVGT